MSEESLYRFRSELFPKAVFQASLVFLVAVVLALGVNRFRTDGIPLVVDWSSEARLKAATGDGMVIPLNEAVAFYDAREAVFVDARPPDIYAEGHIPGALNVPWQQVNDYLDTFFEKVTDTKAIVIAYCDGEACSLSEDLALMLSDMGYENVKVLINGWTVWTQNGYPTEQGGHREP